MKRLILLLALVAATKGLFLNRIIKTFTSPAVVEPEVVEPAVVLQPEEVPLNYRINEYSYPSPVSQITTTNLVQNPIFQNVISQAVSQGASIDLRELSSPSYQEFSPVREITTTNLVHNPLFQNVIRQAVSQGASIDLRQLSAPDYQELIHVMNISPSISPDQIALNTPLYIPPANILPLEQLPFEQQSRYFWPINVLPFPSAPVETIVSTSESKAESSEEESAEVQESAKEISSSSTVDNSATKITESTKVASPKDESKKINQNLELPSESEPTDFNARDNVVNEELNSLSGDEDFSHSYNLEDGTKVAEKGYVVKNEDGTEILAKKGSYEWVDANGKLIKVDWIADENGFRVLE